MNKNLHKDESGVTLVEMLISLALTIIILASVILVYQANLTTYARTNRRVDTQQNARVAMSEMVREFRHAGWFPENFSASPPSPQFDNGVRIATESAFAMFGDVDGDSTSSAVTYCLDGTILRRVTGPVTAAASFTCSNGQPLAENVASVQFTYYNAAEALIVDPAASSTYTFDSQGLGAIPATTTTTQRGAIRRVRITLTTVMNSPGTGGEQQLYTMTSDVRLRNTT